ncbi:tRNA-queuosine alpha-mannosyltransferase domain-containing protein [Gimesia sp.]|uniref:tRNA-queuosine alpha-mannosyltransferase domain-containing protein n=1 Tax=Gimesia sp. TaxID=2024833 RepID=UPI003A94A757
MRVLAINAYHGGSHREFLMQWISHSVHDFTTLTLPARHWKWRMQHAAVTLALEVRKRIEAGERWDAIFVTDMFDLPAFLGLIPAATAALPRIVYFHENQWTYPLPQGETRDLTYGFINLKSALAADSLWFNSDFHQQEFFQASRDFLQRMPDYAFNAALEECVQQAAVISPGIQKKEMTARSDQKRSLQLLWVARWEYDKNPEQFCDAIRMLDRAGVDFRLSVLGQSTPEIPDCFISLHTEYADRIDHWGFLEDRSEYQRVLAHADLVISTAIHEFFGISILEAVEAGCLPVLPSRLAYPEIFAETPECFYDGSTESLVARIEALSQSTQPDSTDADLRDRLGKITARYHWEQISRELDTGLDLSRNRCSR